MYRKSEEPSPTSIECYRKKSLLSSVGSTIKDKEIISLLNKVEKKVPVIKHNNNKNFLQSILDHPEAKNCNSHMIKFHLKNEIQKISLFHLSVCYNGDRHDVKNFEGNCASFLNTENCIKVSEKTNGRSESMLWYEMKFGRITAYCLYEAAHCKTFNGSLVEKILSQKDVVDTLEMQRGRELESIV